MVILDTNHISVLERRGADARSLIARLTAIPVSDVYVTVVSYEEQIRGWMATLAAAKSGSAQVLQYTRLMTQLENYCNLSVLPYTAEAATQFETLRKQHRRLSSPDLKIAAIALVNDAMLLTQNVRDFRNITGLQTEDWTR
ncbi:MAG: PilT protein domain protein [Chthonomonadales bacterium]|nr:PilT protein domain protein [Chthonomonadales bacterium]